MIDCHLPCILGWRLITIHKRLGHRDCDLSGYVSVFIAADGREVSSVVLEAVLIISTVWLPYLPQVHHSPDNHYFQIPHRAF
jgi:hypothetical protein